MTLEPSPVVAEAEEPVGHLTRALGALERAYSSGHHGRWSARRRAELADAAVSGLASGLGRNIALVALGGYGRGQLAPRSDIDLMVLHRGENADAMFEAAGRVFYPFWDAGIPLGHAVRTMEESVALARARLDALTALMDARLIWGDAALFQKLERAVAGLVEEDPAQFLRDLGAAAAERRGRFGSASELLEPDLKESGGGLRDVHMLGWAARGVGARDAEGLARAGLLRAREAAAVEEAEEFLIRLRSALHIESGRRLDRLHLELQPRLAEVFGYEATAGLGASDALMRALFEHARAVEHVVDAVVGRILAKLGGAPASVEVSRPANAEEVMAAFAAMAGSGTPVAPEVLDALEEVVVGTPAWTPRVRDDFVAILRGGGNGVRALEAMDGAGLLARFLPEWEPVRCRPQRDPYHRFSVDVHLLQTVEEVARILTGEDVDDPVAVEAATAVTDPDAVLLGALLHDIGKVGRGGHVPRGAEIAAGVLERMGVPERTADAVHFLVREHLLLSDTAVRRDLSDENLVLDVAARVQDPERLAMLYVLTVADGRATGPHAHTPWRQALVRELVGKVQRVLERKEMGPDLAEDLEARLAEVRGRLAPEDSAAVDAYVDGLPRAYVLAVPPARAAAHFSLVAPPLGAAEARSQARPGDRAGTYEVTVVVRDRPGLLALIAGSLAVNGLNILSARAFTTEDGVAIDLFVVQPAFHGEVEEDRWRRFRGDLRHALEGRISLAHRIQEKRGYYPAPRAEVPVEVGVDNEASDFATVIEVSAPDRLGLLHDLAAALHDLELDVRLVVVATYGDRVVDSFYVRDLVGEKVTDPERIAAIGQAIAERVTAAPG